MDFYFTLPKYGLVRNNRFGPIKPVFQTICLSDHSVVGSSGSLLDAWDLLSDHSLMARLAPPIEARESIREGCPISGIDDNLSEEAAPPLI